MANPITWQNIQTPSQGNPAQFMQLAQTGIDGAFDKLQGVLKQRETTDQANWDQVAVNNAEALKSALYDITTPEQMAAAQKSGQFNNMLTGYGAQVKDPAALRALMEGRMGVLQKQTTDGIAHDTAVAANKNAPILEEYLTASPARQAEIVAQNPGMAGLGAAVQATQKFGWDRDKAKQEADLAPLTQASVQAQTAVSAAQALNIPKELTIRQSEANVRNFDKLNEIATATAEKLSKVSSNSIGSKGAMDGLITNLGKVVEDKNTVGKVSSQLSKALMSNPEFSNLPSSVVEAIALKQTRNVTDWFGSDRTKAMIADLAAALKEQGTTMSTAAATRASLTSLLQQQRLSVDEAQRIAFPDLAKQIDAAKEKAAAEKLAAPKVGVAAPAEVVAPVGSPVAVPAIGKSMIEQQAEVEKAERNIGLITKYSPEVQKYFANQTTEEKKADAAQVLKAELYNNGYTAAPMGMQYTNADIQGPINAAKQKRAAFEKMIADAKKAK